MNASFQPSENTLRIHNFKMLNRKSKGQKLSSIKPTKKYLTKKYLTKTNRYLSSSNVHFIT